MKSLSIDEYILLNYKKKTNAQMALECGCNKSTISNHRKKLGISQTEFNKKLRDKAEYICSQKGKRTKASLAKELNCSSQFIEKIWKENNLTNQYSQVYKLNENYFEKIDKPEKAYWIGFIAADGCLYRREGHQGMISIGISSADIELLESFKQEIETTKPINITQDKRRPNTKMATLQITSDIMFNQLLNLGIGIRKTFDLSILQIINNIEKDFIPSFILGYFDGDGSIDIPQDGTISKSHVRICSPIKNLLDFQIFLNKKEIESSIIEDKRKYKEPFGSLELVSTIQKYIFLKYIYYNNVKCLRRKKERSDELIKRIETNITNRSENIQAIEKYKSVVVKWGELLES
jgi:hypothetical protein